MGSLLETPSWPYHLMSGMVNEVGAKRNSSPVGYNNVSSTRRHSLLGYCYRCWYCITEKCSFNWTMQRNWKGCYEWVVFGDRLDRPCRHNKYQRILTKYTYHCTQMTLLTLHHSSVIPIRAFTCKGTVCDDKLPGIL